MFKSEKYIYESIAIKVMHIHDKCALIYLFQLVLGKFN